MSEVRRRWVVGDQVGGEVVVGHVAFIVLVEADSRVWKQVQPVSFLFGRRVGLPFMWVFWFTNR